jgi:hypothetical protein
MTSDPTLFNKGVFDWGVFGGDVREYFKFFMFGSIFKMREEGR